MALAAKHFTLTLLDTIGYYFILLDDGRDIQSQRNRAPTKINSLATPIAGLHGTGAGIHAGIVGDHIGSG